MDYKYVSEMIKEKIEWGKKVGHNTILIPVTITEAEQLVKLLEEKVGDK